MVKYFFYWAEQGFRWLLSKKSKGNNISHCWSNRDTE